MCNQNMWPNLLTTRDVSYYFNYILYEHFCSLASFVSEREFVCKTNDDRVLVGGRLLEGRWLIEIK